MYLPPILEKHPVLMTVKTYPEPTVNGEVVCSAGITTDEEGGRKWVRIHGILFRTLRESQKFTKFQWINIDAKKHPSDKRPESYKILNEEWEMGDKIQSTKGGWAKRHELIAKAGIYTSMSELIGDMNGRDVSLATLKPSEIIDLKCEKVDGKWDENKLRKINSQLCCFEDMDPSDIVEKVPYRFRFLFKSEGDKEPRSIVIRDWEIFSLYLNVRDKAESEQKTLELVRSKFLDDLASRDIHFFMGTNFEWHMKRGPNPFMIIGVYYPPYERAIQPEIF